MLIHTYIHTYTIHIFPLKAFKCCACKYIYVNMHTYIVHLLFKNHIYVIHTSRNITYIHTYIHTCIHTPYKYTYSTYHLSIHLLYIHTVHPSIYPYIHTYIHTYIHSPVHVVYHQGIFPRLAYEIFNMKQDGWKISMKYFQNVVDTVRDLMSSSAEEQHYKNGMRKDPDGFMDIEWCGTKVRDRICMYVCVYVWLCVFVCMYVCRPLCVCVCMYLCINA